MKLLMHICCANCCLYPLQALKEKGISTSGLWFNPNIHPYSEYRERLKALKYLQEEWRLDIDYSDNYGLREFIRAVVNREDNRCGYCYSTRLEKTAKKAKEYGFDAFTTSLLVSPYQKIDIIRKTGERLAEKYNMEFFFEDFRTGYSKGVEISKALGLYRQKYCGCIYSEEERYLNKKT
ncbi:hypothetical protein BMS3Abin07_02446 [bacterium BMS3Abin07]|nr:hypothetical protein BMS3Abin07_02446 [bacterium BMS3Abin07]GBE31508.1 hypothetical protein BMS3Bbin05_00409 [bacterium BMS3Bbin05]HDL19903.1 epoxyqueuosine reductase QueH [Nitrospirota bacterium]HDO22583.1 epoxyqueuosine reductase QueH [Nitrospirota bacterium]HDZ87087.1 epoxyqueuosine reductase QueH [Nitrospirota bacterium]